MAANTGISTSSAMDATTMSKMRLSVMLFSKYSFPHAFYPVGTPAGGLEGRRPSKNVTISGVVAGKAGNHTRKKEILGRLRLPKPLRSAGSALRNAAHPHAAR